MAKKVSFGTKQQTSKGQPSADAWVEGRGGTVSGNNSKDKEEITRFTIDIPTDLHARIKSQCALRKVKMRDEIQALLEKHFSQI
jgi:hypothetical protein